MAAATHISWITDFIKKRAVLSTVYRLLLTFHVGIHIMMFVVSTYCLHAFSLYLSIDFSASVRDATPAELLAAIMAAEHFTHMFLISFYSQLPPWFQVIKEKIRDQSEELVREVRSQVADLCLEVDQTSAKERAKLLRTVDELSRQLERITSSCNVVKDLLGKATAYDVSTLREDVLYSLETPREILDLPSVPRYVPLLPLEGDPGPTLCAQISTTA